MSESLDQLEKELPYPNIKQFTRKISDVELPGYFPSWHLDNTWEEGDALFRERRKLTMIEQNKQPKEKLKDGDKDWKHKCVNCDDLPTVYPTKLCGPCYFGEPETYEGNW